MKSKQDILECDCCGKKKIAKHTIYIGGHPFNGWFTVNKRNNTSCVPIMESKTEFDFCSEKCLKEYDYVKGAKGENNGQIY